MNLDSTYSLPIKGLPDGEQLYHFKVDGNLFSNFRDTLSEEEQVLSADIDVEVRAQRRVGLIEILASFEGEIMTICDRCLAKLPLKLKFDSPLIVKFGAPDEEVSDKSDDEDVIVLSEDEHDLDLSQFFYDHISLALPLQKLHEEGECDEVMIEKLNQHLFKESTPESDSPFSQLKELIN